MIELPIIDLGPQDTLSCRERPLRIEPVKRSPGELTWQDLSNQDFFIADVPGLVTATIFDGLCYNTDSITIAYKDCVFFESYVPNAFSPNGDGINDHFEIYFPEDLIINSYEMKIYDRWGNKVFESRETTDSWDGTFETKTLSSGVYIYTLKIDYTDEDGPERQVINGDINILR